MTQKLIEFDKPTLAEKLERIMARVKGVKRGSSLTFTASQAERATAKATGNGGGYIPGVVPRLWGIDPRPVSTPCTFFSGIKQNGEQAMPGAPRKPKSQHVIDGTWHKAAANAPSLAMATAGGPPPQPKDLDPVAKGAWEFIAKTRANWLSISDGLAMRHLAELWSLRSAALELLKASPTDRAARCAFTQYGSEFVKLSSKFGLSPADRARLGEVDPDEFDPAAEFVN